MKEEIRLIYYSEATREISLLDIQNILTVARDNNKNLNICGMLCYESLYFLQVLEGDKNLVHDLYEKISKDERHEGIEVVSEEIIRQRHFTEWQMGYAGSSSQFHDALKNLGLDEFSPEDMSSKECLNFLLSLTGAQTV